VAASPWPIYPRCIGVDSPSAVTVAAVEGPHNVHDMWSTGPGPIFSKIASTMTTLGSNNAPVVNAEFFVVLCPEHAQQAVADGWSRRDAQLFLYQHARMKQGLRRQHFETLGYGVPWVASIDDPEAFLPMTSDPDDIRIMVAGGPGKHSCIIPSWGPSRSVTMPVDVLSVPDNR
jgi:hypothetical protein